MNRKKVLIITYYWPPGGGAGVQRWLKFVKYLPQFGWDAIVYTPANGEMPVLDPSLEKDVPSDTLVIRRPIWEPYSLYKLFIGAQKNERINTGFLSENKRPGIAQRLSVWLRGNLFIPDARCFWINPSVRYLRNWLRSNHVDAIISSGPPHSMHLIARDIANETGLPWIADFRDPWTNIDYYKDLHLSQWADRKHRRLEASVIKQASKVVVVGSGMRDEFKAAYGIEPEVITNGYDEDDFKVDDISPSSDFVLAHVGTLVPSRNPVQLWKVLGEMVRENPRFRSVFKLRLVGKVDVTIREAIKLSGLTGHVEYIDYITHDRVPIELKKASALLLVLNDTPNAKGILTGKLFEYLAAQRTVICLGPRDGDAAKVLDETGAGVTVSFNDANGIKKMMEDVFKRYESGSLRLDGRQSVQYSRRSLSQQLSMLLDTLVKRNNLS